MSLSFRSLASGSSGNCLLLQGKTNLLIDAGISASGIRKGLAEAGLVPEELSCILITHEHSDHIAGLNVFLKHWPIPVYASRGTVRALCPEGGRPLIPEHLLHVLEPGESLTVFSCEVASFPVSHDAAAPVAFRLTLEGRSVGVVTDLGCTDSRLVSVMQGLDALYLEANHDSRMLEVGPYPYPLKRRVAGAGGHLSNDAAGAFLSEVWHPGLCAVMLGHLSRENNYPPLALETVKEALRLSRGEEAAGQTKILVSPRTGLSDPILLP